MASRTVALDDEAYELLRSQKRPAESFSAAIKRLARPRRPLSSFGGMWKDMTKAERRELDAVYSGLREGDRTRSAKIRRRWG